MAKGKEKKKLLEISWSCFTSLSPVEFPTVYKIEKPCWAECTMAWIKSILTLCIPRLNLVIDSNEKKLW